MKDRLKVSPKIVSLLICQNGGEITQEEEIKH